MGWPLPPRPNLQKLPTKAVWVSKVTGDILIGKVKLITQIGLDRVPCLKLKIPQNNFHEYNRMFFLTNYEQWALDPESRCKVGDVVLIKRAREHERASSQIHYAVEKVIFEYGNIIDPITKRRLIDGNEFEQEVEVRKGVIGDIFNDPLADETETTLTHEKKRQLRRQKLQRRKEELGRRMGSENEEQNEETLD